MTTEKIKSFFDECPAFKSEVCVLWKAVRLDTGDTVALKAVRKSAQTPQAGGGSEAGLTSTPALFFKKIS